MLWWAELGRIPGDEVLQGPHAPSRRRTDMNVDKLRFGVMRGDVAASSLWVAWTRKSDFYLGINGQTGHCKVSLHASRWTRFALDERYVGRLATASDAQPDRALTKVRRPETPGTGAVHVLSLVFPTDALGGAKPITKGRPGKPVFWFEAAPEGKALEIGFFYSTETPTTLSKKLERIGTPFGVCELESGEFVSLVARTQPLDFDVDSLFSRGRVRPLSDALSNLASGEALPSVGAIAVNEPPDGGAPSIIEITGLSIQRS